MRKIIMVPALLLAVGTGACDHDLLDVNPVDEISDEIAIVDETSARAALMGAYSGLQSTDYYGGEYILWTETLTDNATHTGTFESYADADLLFLTSDIFSIQVMWESIYDAINRANLLIQKVPDLEDVPQGVKDEILGQAYGLRALHYFALVRAWGGVPLVLVPPENLDEAAQVSRATADQVYDAILSDLDASRTRLAAAGMDNSNRTFMTPGFGDALEAKVLLYREDWAGAAAAAQTVMDNPDYSLAGSYAALFTAAGDPTPEDIFRVVFVGSAPDWNNFGYYYLFDGRFEIGATQDIYDLYDQANDERWDVNFEGTRSDGIEVAKYPTTIGSENPHVIRYGEILLIRAEALAQQGGAANLDEAVSLVNQIRSRAGLTGYDLSTDLGDDQQQVLDAIDLERRMELAFEGERWFDLVRTGRAAAVLGANFDEHESLLPIPVTELDVAPNLNQNPGY